MICPCCGQPIDQSPPLADLQALLASHSHVSRRILEILARAYPRSVTGHRLADLVYESDPDGGAGSNSIAVVIIHLRKKIALCGWTIPLAKGGPNASGYQLRPLGQRQGPAR